MLKLGSAQSQISFFKNPKLSYTSQKFKPVKIVLYSHRWFSQEVTLRHIFIDFEILRVKVLPSQLASFKSKLSKLAIAARDGTCAHGKFTLARVRRFHGNKWALQVTSSNR